MSKMFKRWRERLFKAGAALALGLAAGDAAGQIPARLPVITNQPQSLTVQIGQPAAFTVGARDATNVPPVNRAGGEAPDRFVFEAGTPRGTLVLAYDFYFTPDQVEVFHGGARIYDSGSISNAGTLEIPFGPGATTALEIVVNGTGSVPGTFWEYTASIVRPPLSYQWRRNGTAISGATNNPHVIVAAQPADAGTYSAGVSNASGGLLSTGAVFTVTGTNPPSITSITPTNLTVFVGSNVAFNVSATGAAPLFYQWQFGGVNLPGRTSATLAFGGAQFANAGLYRCVVTNAFGTAISPEVVLNVVSPTSGPPVITFPAALTLVVAQPGSNALLRVAANGEQPLGYHWFRNGPTQPLPGLTTATNRLLNIQQSDAGAYIVVVSNRLGMATNLGWVVNVLAGGGGGTINLTMTPAMTNVLVFDATGSSNRLPVGARFLCQLYVATNTEPLWPLGGTGAFSPAGRTLGGAKRLTGIATGQVVQAQIRAWDSLFGASYEQAVENGGRIGSSVVIPVAPLFGSAAGAPLLGLESFWLTPGLPPVITAGPQSLIITQGMDASFSVSAGGSGPRTFQWRFNGLDLPGANGPTLILPEAQPDQSGDYTAVVANHVGSVTSAVAVLTVVRTNRPPVAQSLGVTFFEDTTAAFTLSASDPDGDTLTYHVGTPAFGTLSGTPPNLIYRPNSNYYGLDSFSFTVGDGQFTSTEAAVLLHIAAVEDFPIAFPGALALDEDTSAPVTLLSYDGDGDPLTYAVTAPAHGTLSGTPPDLLYTPAPDYHGPDSFTFTVNDGASSEPISPPATITITVRPVNDVPLPRATVSPLAALTPGDTNWLVLSPNGSNAAVILDASASTDPEGDALEFLWLEGGVPFGGGVRLTNVFPAGHHIVTLLADDGTDTAAGVFTFAVVSPGEAIEAVLLMVDSSALPENRLRPLRATLKAGVASAERGNLNACANQLRAFLHKVSAQVAPHDPALAAELTAACQAILRAIGGG